MTNSLQIRKTLILKNSSTKNNARKRFSNDNRLNIFIEIEIIFYKTIQKIFFKFTFFVHYNWTCQLYVDINTSHERDFDVTIFHVKNDKTIFIKNDIKLILFFNKIFTSIEIKYWFTKLKTIDLIWLVKRIRHIIEIVVVTFQIIIYIDYSITTNIVKQTKIIFNNTNKLNFRLIRAFTYLSQYQFDVRHKLEKQHIIFNAFFKLFFNVESIKKTLDSNQSKNIFDMIYYITLIKIFDDFKFKLKKIYRINKRWVKILKLIKFKAFLSIITISSIVKNFFTNTSSIAKQFVILQSIDSQTLESTSMNSLTKSIVFENSWFNRENLRFRYRDDLIYYVNDLNNERERLCILKSFIDEIFVLIHNKLSHVDYHKIYDKIVTFFFIRKLSKKFQIYVTYCS